MLYIRLRLKIRRTWIFNQYTRYGGVKGQNVIIDSDVARIYGVETKEINQAARNNPEKFPSGYIIEADKDELVKIFDRFKNLKHSTVQPKAFTEKGLYMRLSVRTGSYCIEKPEGNGGNDSDYRGDVYRCGTCHPNQIQDYVAE
jgi:hypothetical protein